LAAILAPVRLARVFRMVNRNSPGELLAYTDPSAVARSLMLRIQWRVSGALVLAFGLTLFQVIRNPIEIFAVILIGLGAALCLKPSSVLFLFSARTQTDGALASKHAWGLRLVGFISAAVGGWLLIAYR
jgi:hypothetical protein